MHLGRWPTQVLMALTLCASTLLMFGGDQGHLESSGGVSSTPGCLVLLGPPKSHPCFGDQRWSARLWAMDGDCSSLPDGDGGGIQHRWRCGQLPEL